METTLDIVRAAIAEYCRGGGRYVPLPDSDGGEITAESIEPDCSVVTDIGVDSLGLVELLVMMEQRFGISVPDSDIPMLRSPIEIANYIDRHRN